MSERNKPFLDRLLDYFFAPIELLQAILNGESIPELSPQRKRLALGSIVAAIAVFMLAELIRRLAHIRR
jgi:hypothetical protein